MINSEDANATRRSLITHPSSLPPCLCVLGVLCGEVLVFSILLALGLGAPLHPKMRADVGDRHESETFVETDRPIEPRHVKRQ